MNGLTWLTCPVCDYYYKPGQNKEIDCPRCGYTPIENKNVRMVGKMRLVVEVDLSDVTSDKVEEVYNDILNDKKLIYEIQRTIKNKLECGCFRIED